MDNSRTKKSIRNTIVALVEQGIRKHTGNLQAAVYSQSI